MASSIDDMMNGLTKSIAHLSFPPRRGKTLFTLPQEVQDIIFDLAYPRVHGSKLITRDIWYERELEHRKKKGTGYKARPFPQLKVIGFLVSKQFFLSASRAFIGNQVFDERVGQSIPTPVLSGSNIQDVLRGFVTSVVVEAGRAWMYGCDEGLSRLKSYTLAIHEFHFDCVAPKIVFEDKLDETDFDKVMTSLHMSDLRGLQRIQLLASDCRFTNTEAKIAMWHQNVRDFQAFLKPIVTRPKLVADKDQKHEGDLFPDVKSLSAFLGRSKTHFAKKQKSNDSTAINDPSPSCFARSDFFPSAGSTTKKRTGFDRLEDEDVPYDLERFKKMLEVDGESVMAWVNSLRYVAAEARLRESTEMGH